METAQNEIKALRATEVFKDKAVEELESEVKRLRDKLRVTENLLEQKNLDMKKLRNEKKEALAAQYAAEATLRRVYADQKDDDFVPMESIIAPLEADIKMYKNEEENKILDKTNRQKVSEVEKLSQTIVELEQAILAGGEAANTIRAVAWLIFLTFGSDQVEDCECVIKSDMDGNENRDQNEEQQDYNEGTEDIEEQTGERQVLVEQDLLDHYQQFVEFQGLVVQHVLDLGECHE
ncbi:hypothetical protein ACH5RR_014655 [Cinchona calisaya]|uniref:Uncharacterized protein n=1 Tax=Cinchona calisaya TaxID=153742 RepID=A0ABD2ZQW4_9GENT